MPSSLVLDIVPALVLSCATIARADVPYFATGLFYSGFVDLVLDLVLDLVRDVDARNGHRGRIDGLIPTFEGGHSGTEALKVGKHARLERHEVRSLGIPRDGQVGAVVGNVELVVGAIGGLSLKRDDRAVRDATEGQSIEEFHLGASW